MSTLRERCLQFLYKQVTESKIPMIRKGMVEDLELFVLGETSNVELAKTSQRMMDESQKSSEEANEEDIER